MVQGDFPGAVAVLRDLPEGVDRPGLPTVVWVADGDQITNLIPFLLLKSKIFIRLFSLKRKYLFLQTPHYLLIVEEERYFFI